MRLLLPALLLLGACSAPDSASPPDSTPPGSEQTPNAQPIVEPGFDAAGWMDAVEAASTDPDRVVLSARLLDAVDWRTACGEDDPTAEGRGVVRLLHLDADNSLAEITCQRFAYQTTFALVDARAGRPPRLIRALGVTEAGVPTADTTASFFGIATHDADLAPTRFDILTKSAGHGGCGTDVRYRLVPSGGAAVERIRAHADCGDPLAPDQWPVTYEGS